MSLIKLLPDHLINQIAAGEVVERPSSVVKELIENSIDAGAKNIVVEIEDGGKRLIKISDDGKGMSEEDLMLSVKRHATSKIINEDDLWQIRSFGFRGEALASISSVSKFTIRTREKHSDFGYELNLEGEEIMQKKEVGMPEGTQIEVQSLFFNTPARQKYLKKENTEFSNISHSFNTIALSNLDVSFKLIHNQKLVSDYPAVNDAKLRIADIFGGATASLLLDVFYGAKDLKIDGFIAKPSLSRSNTKHQYFFVNGRYVRSPLLANTIKQAYKTLLMEHKNPVFFININLDPSKIDVNVHPRKLEIRFEDTQYIIKTIYNVVKKALDTGDLIPKGFSEAKNYMSSKTVMDTNKKASFDFKPSSYNPVNNTSFNKRHSTQSAIEFTKSFSTTANKFSNISAENQNTENLSEEIEKDFGDKTIAIAQLNKSYIIAKSAETLILIDQHAAHERVRYEELMDQFENQKKDIQTLLIPQLIELTTAEKQLIEENKQIFTDLGFEINHFGANTFNLTAVPRFLADEDFDDVIRGVIDDILEKSSSSKFQGKTEEAITYMSCRSAIKFGQTLSLSEMQALIDKMDSLKRPYTCPHGRPTMISLTMKELEKMFGRS